MKKNPTSGLGVHLDYLWAREKKKITFRWSCIFRWNCINWDYLSSYQCTLMPFYDTKFLWINKLLSSLLLDLLSRQPSSLHNAAHDDIRVTMPSVRLQLSTSRLLGAGWREEDLFQETLISSFIVLVHNLNQSVSYLVCSFQASNNISGFPLHFIITLLL